MNKKITALVVTSAMLVSTFTSFGARSIANAQSIDAKAQIVNQLQAMNSGKLVYEVSQNNGQQTILAGRLSTKKVPSAAEALNFVQANKEVFGLSNPMASLKVVSVQKDELGYTHVKFNQVVNGTPVEGRELAVHFDNNGYVINVTGNVETTLNVTKNGNKNLTAADAITVAKNGFANKNLKEAAKADKVILVQNGKAYEAYKVNVKFNQPTIANWSVYVDVNSGEIVNTVNNIKDAGAVTGTGTLVNGQSKSLNLYYTGTTYQMKDTTKAMTGTINTYTASNGTTQPGTLMSSSSTTFTDKAANSAHYYGGLVYDFYKNLFNRNSIDNAGMSIISTVHYDRSYNNAFWDGSQMVYGDGDGTQFTYFSGDMDVVGHEMTHGVTERTANLTYSNQSGALNESMSDVLGVLIETYDKYNVKGGGTWTFNSADWTVGDDIYTPGTSGDALRSLANPALYSQPANMSGYVNTTSDNGGVHTNSGIPNKAAYLVAQSIGCEKTARIYYRGLTTYFTSSTDFTGARTGLIQAATDLYGAGSAEVTAVQNAYASVGIGSSGGGGGTTDTYEPNDSTSSAYAITSGTTYNSYISTSTDVDYYKIAPTTSGTISVTLGNLPGDYDLYLYNSAGTQVASSTNSSTTSESISYSAAAGTYYIKVLGYSGAYSTSTAYALKATFSGSTGSLDPYEPNDSMSTAYAMTSGTTYKALIGSTTDADVFKITKSASGTISVSLTTLPGDYDLYLFNSAGTQVASSENAGTTSESISYSAAAGTYYVEVVGYNGAYSTTTQYSLKATF